MYSSKLARYGLVAALSPLVFLVSCGGGASVTVSCTPAVVQTGQTSQCTATAIGKLKNYSAVTWSARPGTIDSSGLFTASTIGNAIVTATLAADTATSGNATVSATLDPSAISFQDSFKYPDGAQLHGQTAPTGQTWSVTGYDSTDVQVWANHLISYPTSAKAGPWYAYIIDTGGNVHSYSTTFTLAANGGTGQCNLPAMIINGDPNHLLDKMIHAILSCKGVYITWWNKSNQNNLPVYVSNKSGTWLSGMTMTPGNTYTLTLTWDGGDWVYFTGPDGGIISFYDPNFAAVGGSGIIWEGASQPTDSLYSALSNVTVTK